MAISILCLVFLPALLVVAAVSDLLSFTIPNAVPASIIALFVVFLLELALAGHALSFTATGFHLLAGLAGLVLGMAFFAAGWIGGGDAKLFAAVALWLGWGVLFEYAIALSLLGGVLTFGIIVLRRFPLPAKLAAWSWVARLADPKAGIPYGIALAAAALIVLPDTELFAMTVGS